MEKIKFRLFALGVLIATALELIPTIEYMLKNSINWKVAGIISISTLFIVFIPLIAYKLASKRGGNGIDGKFFNISAGYICMRYGDFSFIWERLGESYNFMLFVSLFIFSYIVAYQPFKYRIISKS